MFLSDYKVQRRIVDKILLGYSLHVCKRKGVKRIMRWRIEPPAAKREVYSSGARVPVGEKETYVLDLALQRQELEHWCWAAIAASLGDYYGLRHLSQHEIAGTLLGLDCTGIREDPHARARCDATAMLDEALKLVGCFSHWSPGRPAFERIQAEIDTGRPVCLAVDWKTGGSHYAVVTGYSTGSRELFVEDPLLGPSVQQFDAFPAHYRGTGGYWRGTYWTCPPTAGTIRS